MRERESREPRKGADSVVEGDVWHSSGESSGIIDLREVSLEVAPDGTIVFVGSGYSKMTGFDSGDCIGRSLLSLVSSEDVSLVRTLIASRGASEGRVRLKRRDGAHEPSTISFRYLQEGRIICFVQSRRQEAHEVQQSRGLDYEALLSSSPDAMLVLERSGVILLANNQVEEMFGHRKQTLINKDMGLLLPDRLRNYFQHLLAKSFDFPLGPPRHVFGRRKDRTEFPLDITLNPLKLDAREVIVLALRDVSEREALTAELRSRTEALEREIAERQRVEVELRLAQKLEAVGQLAAGVAHEINTPLQYVGDSLAYVAEASEGLIRLAKSMHVLTSAPTTNEKTMGYLLAALDDADWGFTEQELPRALQRATEGIRRVTEIVTSMRDLSHPDRPEMEETNIIKAIRVAARLSGSQLGEAGEIHLHLPRTVMLECHSGAVKQALVNLIVNAAHAVRGVYEKTGEKGQIDIDCIESETEVSISVGDTGGGIPDAFSSRVFDPFFTTKEVGRGTGQGLAIARAIVVERHGGSLTFATEEGVGTTFRMTLPKTRSSAQENHS